MKEDPGKVEIKTADPWKLVCIIAHYAYTLTNLTTSFRVKCFRFIWATQDGYGTPGYTPDQGYDWSGIRDSSPEAKKKMCDYVVKQLALTNLVALKYTKTVY